MPKLEQLSFDNTFATLPEIFYSEHQPVGLHKDFLIHFNADIAGVLGIDKEEASRDDFLDIFMGRKPFQGFKPLAACYAGHQFGHFVPRLGDGRAILLGQLIDEQQRRWDLQLKGAGNTLYSRDGDGRAVLRSSIREYLCSMAMHGLGIPTTHALFLSGSEQEVYREQIEPGAMVLRVAPSHIRFGSFEYFFHSQRYDDLQLLFDYVVQTYFPHLQDTDNPAVTFLDEVISSTASMIAQWQAAGFAHGVMNSDNMSIHGITLDYGPFGFIEHYDPDFICNHSDYHGRYAFSRQPEIGLFNLSCLAQAMLPLLDADVDRAVETAKRSLESYQRQFEQHYQSLMFAKLGLTEHEDGDQALLESLLDLMQTNHTDYTILFRKLSDSLGEEDIGRCRDLFIDRESFDRWYAKYHDRLQRDSVSPATRSQRMKQVNPKYILRNYMAETAIRKAQGDGDYSEIDILMKILRRPFDEHTEYESYAGHPPEWAQGIEVSCSS
jgi:uncharacterized protein YdiU (UPF0061 family)